MGHSLNFTIQDLSSPLAVTLESFQLLFLRRVRLCPMTSLCLHHCQQMSFSNAVVRYQKSCDTSPQLSMSTYLFNLFFHKWLNCIFRGRLSKESTWWGVPQISRDTVIKRRGSIIKFLKYFFLSSDFLKYFLVFSDWHWRNRGPKRNHVLQFICQRPWKSRFIYENFL